jgi:hypothetical protein
MRTEDYPASSSSLQKTGEYVLPLQYFVYNLVLHLILCSGGIIGLGEAEEDRVGLLHTLATLPTHPESVPINALVAVKGTPLEDQKVFRTADYFV